MELPNLDKITRQLDWQTSTGQQRNKAQRKQQALMLYQQGLTQGLTKTAAVQAVARLQGVSPGTVYRWLKSDNTLDKHKSGRPMEVWKNRGAEEAWAYYCADYLRLEQPASQACYRRVEALARVNGWDIPSEVSFRRRIKTTYSPAAIARAREGTTGLLKTFPYQQRSVKDLLPLDWVCGDGRKHDVFVIRGKGEKPVRPVVWYWQDIYSRRILAWRAGLVESAELVRLALSDLCHNHGVPQHILIDNTRAAAAKWLSGGSRNRKRWVSSGEDVPGIMNLLGIQVHHSGIERSAEGKAVGRGWAKPVERAFRDLSETIDRHPRARGAYTGRSPFHKPENYQRRALTWDDFINLVTSCVTAHNAQSGRRTETAENGSFDDAWRQAVHRVAVRTLSESQRALLLLACESTKVRKDGTLALKAGRGAGLPANRYHHVGLLEHSGRNLVARFDPDDLHNGVHVYDLQGRWICLAECLMPVGFASSAAAKAHHRAKQQQQRATKAELAALKKMRELLTDYAVPHRPSPEVEVDRGKIIRLVPDRIEHPKNPPPDKRASLQARLRRGRQLLDMDEENSV